MRKTLLKAAAWLASSGFGLGLSIARRLGERVGIGIAIDSTPGGGTRASLSWPDNPPGERRSG